MASGLSKLVRSLANTSLLANTSFCEIKSLSSVLKT